MPFVKGVSGNPKGRGKGTDLINPKSLTKTEIREKELKQILRRLKPLNSKVIAKFEEMFVDEKTTEAGRVKLGVFLLKTYTDLIDDVYKVEAVKDDKEEDDLNKKPAPIVQFTQHKKA